MTCPSLNTIIVGIEGMKRYWAHTLEEEAAVYVNTFTDDVYRIDMHDCPSKGFLIRNGLVQYRDYCDHCMGWVGPVMQKAGFVDYSRGKVVVLDEFQPDVEHMRRPAGRIDVDDADAGATAARIDADDAHGGAGSRDG